MAEVGWPVYHRRFILEEQGAISCFSAAARQRNQSRQGQGPHTPKSKSEAASMAISHLSVKVGPAGKAGPHAAYIAREGKYAARLEKGERLDAKESGNLPAWAQANPQEFWQAADRHERANGTTYREFEIALPRELAATDRLALVREFIQQELGDRHAYQFAIHCPTAVDGKEQPHAHVMFSERQRDGIERDPAQYFKRYNAKAPEKGGAKKGWGEHAGKTRAKDERAADLKALRRRWEQTCNAALERVGHAERIDLRSNAERGLNLPPERKMRPSEWRTRRAEVIEFRQARAELSKAVPDAAAEILNLEERRREAERPPRGSTERTGPAVKSSRFTARKQAQPSFEETIHRAIWGELAEEEIRQSATEEGKPKPKAKTTRQAAAERARLSRPDFETMPVEQQAKAFDHLHQTLALGRKARLGLVAQKAADRCDRRAKAVNKIWEISPKPPTGLLANFKWGAYEKAFNQWQENRMQLDKLHDQARRTHENIIMETRDNATEVWAMRGMKRIEPDLTRRVEAHRAAELAKQQEQYRQEQARTALEEEFKGMAAFRALKIRGYEDGGKKWQATPQPLREIIEDYNSLTTRQQRQALAARMRDPEKSNEIATLIWQHRENTIDRGRNR